MIFLIDLPKPVHGMSNVNKNIFDNVVDCDIELKVINTAPSYASQLFPTRWWVVIKLIHSLFCFMSLFLNSLWNFGGIIYRPINGGGGQVYDLFYIIIARLFIQKIYIHHHSFNYLNDKGFLFTLLNWLAGDSAVHIVLGTKMGSVLSELYNVDKNQIKIVSNLVFFNTTSKEVKRTEDKKIFLGHLANLCTEKGVDIFIDACRELALLDVDFSAELAGPFVDKKTKELVLNAEKELSQVRYLGPVYEDAKTSFYSNLDCFIFPSKYKNEAEPLVLYEAALTGVFLIGTRRGCMQDVIEKLTGLTVAETDKTASEIALAIKKLVDSGVFSIENRLKRLEVFKSEQIKAKAALADLINEMKSYELSKTK